MDLSSLKFVVSTEGGSPEAAFKRRPEAEGYMHREARRYPYLKYCLHDSVDGTTVTFMYDPEIGEFATV